MNQRINDMMKNPAIVAGLSATIAGALGTFIGFGLGRRSALNEDYEDDYPIVSVAESELSPETLKLLEERRRNGTRAPIIKGPRPTKVITDDPPEVVTEVTVVEQIETDDEEATLVSRTVFAQDGPNWDTEAEMKLRETQSIYPLHQDEYYEGEPEGLQLTFVYYEMDNVLADQDEVPIPIPEHRVGPFLWGHGSTDRNRFFVRNTERKEEYEIIREPDKYYMVEVRGLELEEVAEASELRHSAIPKMRQTE